MNNYYMSYFVPPMDYVQNDFIPNYEMIPSDFYFPNVANKRNQIEFLDEGLGSFGNTYYSPQRRAGATHKERSTTHEEVKEVTNRTPDLRLDRRNRIDQLKLHTKKKQKHDNKRHQQSNVKRNHGGLQKTRHHSQRHRNATVDHHTRRHSLFRYAC